MTARNLLTAIAGTLTAITLLAIGATSPVSASDEYGSYMDAVQPDDEWEIRTAVIRITPGDHHSQGWPENSDSSSDYYMNTGLYLHANSAHITVGTTPEVLIQKSTGRVYIETPGATMGTVLVTGDETAARNRLMFGASGGNGHIHVEVSDPNGTVNLASQSAYDALAQPNLNLWIAWLSPKVRGTGDPSKADQALTDLADLEARVEALEQGALSCSG